MTVEERLRHLEKRERRYRMLATLLALVLVMVVTVAATTAERRWGMESGSFGEASFYAVKFNYATGESWVFSAERGAKDDKWIKLPSENRTKQGYQR